MNKRKKKQVNMSDLQFEMEEYIITIPKRLKLRFEGRGRRKAMFVVFRQDLNLSDIPNDCHPTFPEKYLVPVDEIKSITNQRDRIIAQEFSRLRAVTKNLNVEISKLRKTREYEVKRKKEFEKRLARHKKQLEKEKDEVERVALQGGVAKWTAAIANQGQILEKIVSDISDKERIYNQNDKIWALQLENLNTLHNEMCMELIRSETKRIREAYGFASFSYPNQPVAAEYLKKTKDLKELKDAQKTI